MADHNLYPGCLHSLQITFTRRWRIVGAKRYYVRCWRCDLRHGPYTHEEEARTHARVIVNQLRARLR